MGVVCLRLTVVEDTGALWNCFFLFGGVVLSPVAVISLCSWSFIRCAVLGLRHTTSLARVSSFSSLGALDTQGLSR